MPSLQERITLSPDDISRHYFVQDGSHLGFAMSPLFASFMVPSVSEGTRRAFAALHFPLRQFLGRIRDGYFYQALVPADGDPADAWRRYRESIRALWPDLIPRYRRTVNEEILPLYGEIDAFSVGVLSATDAVAALRRLEAIYDRIWELHFLLVLPAFAAQEAYLNAYRESFPGSDPSDALRLIRGNFNKSLETDRELSRLAKSARREPRVRAALAGEDAPASLRADPACRPFLRAFEAFLAEYGWRVGNSHEFAHPTWIEEPRFALELIRRYLDSGYDFDAHFEALRATRAREAEEILARIKDPEARRRFAAALEAAFETSMLDEDHHFYIDAMLPAKSRRLLLKIGEVLEAESALRHPEDIFFCYLDEVYAALEGDRVAIASICARRAAYERHKREVPPPSFGSPPAPADPAGTEPDSQEKRFVSGVTAAQGSHRGPARIIEGPEDFVRLHPGDILIARTTTPVWTPLFAIAGAVVTDAGGILSHTATVAREYGIPCVVATGLATRTFRDGEQVSVDAGPGRGTVRAFA